jgi:hypothetical protein
MERLMEQGMNMHGPTPGARVRVWGRGARGSPRGGMRRPEGTCGGFKSAERTSPEAAVSTPEIGRGGAGLRGQGVVRRPYAGEGVFPGEEGEGGDGGARDATGRETSRPGSVGCV